MDRPLSLCHYHLDDRTVCPEPAVADSHDPDDPHAVTPVCAEHADALEGTTVWRRTPASEQST